LGWRDPRQFGSGVISGSLETERAPSSGLDDSGKAADSFCDRHSQAGRYELIHPIAKAGLRDGL
jgi:hypothetical protein